MKSGIVQDKDAVVCYLRQQILFEPADENIRFDRAVEQRRRQQLESFAQGANDIDPPLFMPVALPETTLPAGTVAVLPRHVGSKAAFIYPYDFFSFIGIVRYFLDEGFPCLGIGLGMFERFFYG